MSTKALLSSEDLWKIVADGSRYELSRGELVPMTPVGFQHSWIVARLGKYLGNFVDDRKLGIVGMEGGFKLHSKPDTLRAPDVHFVSRERIAKVGVPVKFADFPPDLAVEVLSPEDRASEVQQKTEEYLSAGVLLLWIVDPVNQRVTVYRSLQNVKVLTPEEELDGGDVLPGFRLKISEIFAI
jgi:Uma2 family endonuclease